MAVFSEDLLHISDDIGQVPGFLLSQGAESAAGRAEVALVVDDDMVASLIEEVAVLER